jgi:thiamine pyrophosphate-dependent acetolactate synthase large subunit-like protein
MDGISAIAKILKSEGVEFIGCVPYQPLLEAAAREDIRPIIFRLESTGIHMVDGYSRVTNGKKLGVFMMQNGPGAENGFGGVAQAFSESVPILLLPAGMPRSKRGVHPNFYPTKSYETITKWSEEINTVERIPDLLRRAFTKLRSGRPGPVLLEIPQDIADGQINDKEVYAYLPPMQLKQSGDPSAIELAAQALLSASNLLLHAGQGVLYAEATQELIEISEFLQCPVMTTLPGKSAFPHNHPLHIGTGSPSTTSAVHHYLPQSDTVFGIGCSFTKTNFSVPIKGKKTFIHTTNDEDAINREFFTEFPILGDTKLVLQQLIAELHRTSKPKPVNNNLQEHIQKLHKQWLQSWEHKLTSSDKPLNPYRVIWDLMHTVDLDNTIITHESGSSREYLGPFWEARHPRSFIGWGKSTQLGYSLGLAMGAKLAEPDKLAINVMGDLAFSTVGIDIETAVRCKIPILTIIINNAYMSIYDDRRFPVAVEKYNIKSLSGEFSSMASSLGAYSEQITNPEGIIPAIKRGIEATQNGQPAVLEFMTKDEGEYSKFSF